MGHLDGKKEGRVGRGPVEVVWSESAGSNDVVNMAMMLQSNRWFQIWSTLKKPISTPRCRVSRASQSGVSANIRSHGCLPARIRHLLAGFRRGQHFGGVPIAVAAPIEANASATPAPAVHFGRPGF